MTRIAIFLLLSVAAFAQSRPRAGEYALILEDPPVAQKAQSRGALTSREAVAHRQRVETAQGSVLKELAARKIAVRRSASLLVNAIYVEADRATALSLASIPGVKRVQFLPPVRRDLSAAVNVVNASTAWSAVGGAGNAGTGIKIGIIDTGIDQNHPGFQDASLTPPSGFPKGDSGFTNSKVIVARSYVSLISAHQYALPDDNSPRDRTGHGTNIAMIAAGVQNTSPLGAIQGVAPKAFLGNYKIFGSPGVNDYTYDDVVEKAMEDALADGMDVVTLSLNEGDIADYGPLDSQAACGEAVCDVRAQGVENAIKLGLTVVTSAGNAGDHGQKLPTRTSIDTPGTAPSAITVGATMNSHAVYQTVRFGSSTVRGLFGDGTRAAAPINAPARDVASTGDNGLACSALPAGSLTGRIALIQRGTCYFDTKINNAQAAGAVAVVMYQVDGSDAIYPILYIQNTAIPTVLIGNTDGKALKAYLAANPDAQVTLDPAFNFADDPNVNSVAVFSSRGPSLGNFAAARDFALKPELVAPGANIYTATQTYDPNGDSFHPSGYNGVSGTSYAVPFVAGAIALVKQKNPNINTPGRLKSAVVNSASSVDLQGSPRITDAGAGKLNIGDAVSVAATLEPAGIGFGPIGTATLPINRSVIITNVSSAQATFTFTVRETAAASSAHVQVSPSSVSLASGANATVTVSLSGSRPSSGAYEGFIDVTGAGTTLHLPYTFFVGDGVPYNVYTVSGGSFIGYPGDQGWLLTLRMLDQYGVPVAGYPVSFRTPAAGGKVEFGDNSTDVIGNAAWFIDMGTQLGDQVFTATAGGLTQEFGGYARRLPTVKSGGVVNAATFQAGQGFAPGSYISIFGTDLADTVAAETTPYLPVSLASTAISFIGGGLSLPGELHFVSPGQVNVQIPWEFQGQRSVKMLISWQDFDWTGGITVPLATYSPGIFAVTDVSGGAINAGNPAKRGAAIVIYANGLGPVDKQPASGEATPSTQPPASTTTAPAVTLGAATPQVLFSGLTPGSIGLYQVNVSIPADAPTGNQPLKLSIGGQDVTVNIPIQ
jgi:minor extracellular serine protease Vpr